MVKRDEPPAVPAHRPADIGPERERMGRDSPQRRQGDPAERGGDERVDRVDLAAEVVGAGGQLGPRRRAVAATIDRLGIAEDGVGDEDVPPRLAGGGKERLEPRAAAVSGEGDACPLGAAPARRLGDEHDRRARSAVQRRQEPAAAVHRRAVAAGRDLLAEGEEGAVAHASIDGAWPAGAAPAPTATTGLSIRASQRSGSRISSIVGR